jgi:protein gp37
MENSKIEWTHHTFNPWVGCTKVSTGLHGACEHCYAESWALRAGRDVWGNRERQRTTRANWLQPLKWNRSVPDGQRRRVFCASLADVFDNTVQLSWRADLFQLIYDTPRLDWLLLTKRIGNAAAMIEQAIRLAGLRAQRPWPWPHVWLGATVVTQAEADRDVPKLCEVPAAVRFLSVEPMQGPVRLARLNAGRTSSLHWIICGGESGPHARPMDPTWCADLRADAERNNIAFFMKQGSQANWPTFKDFSTFPRSLQIREFPDATQTS